MIRAGFIGTGGISSVHLNYLQSRADVEIAALCDIDPAALGRRQEVYGGKPYADFETMLKEVELDAVWICTPPWVRREPLLACAKRGIPVFCEKPVEHRVDHGKQIARALARYKAHVQVGYVFRCLPIVAKARQAIREDRIHLIQSLYGCNVSLTHGLPDWFYIKDRSGGALVDQATHNFDLLRYLFGEVADVKGSATNPVNKKVRGKYTIDEAIGLILVFAGKTVCTHSHTWVGDGWRNEMVFSGEHGMYRLNLGKGQLTVEGSSGPDAVYADGKLDAEIGGTSLFEHRGRGMYVYENEVFLGQVASGDWSENPSDYADGLKTLELTVACNEAISAPKKRGI